MTNYLMISPIINFILLSSSIAYSMVNRDFKKSFSFNRVIFSGLLVNIVISTIAAWLEFT